MAEVNTNTFVNQEDEEYALKYDTSIAMKRTSSNHSNTNQYQHQQQASIPDASLAFEYSEIKRKLERKELDIKRKDKEIMGYQKEIARIHKEVKQSSAEMQSLRERNEQLQQSLINSRLLSQSAREDADTRLSNTRIRDLENALGSSAHKYSLLEADNDSCKQTIIVLQSQVSSLASQIDAIKVSEATALNDINTCTQEYMTKEAILHEKIRRYEVSIAQVNELKDSNTKYTYEVDRLTKYVEKIEAQLLQSKEEAKKLRTTLEVRSETNSVLRAQLEELNGKTFTVSKADMDRFHKLEVDNKKYSSRNSELSKSVELHMDLLHRAEVEVDQYKKEAHDATLAVTNLKAELSKLAIDKGSNKSLLLSSKKEINQLRKDNQELVLEVKEMRKTLSSFDALEMSKMKTGMMTLTKSKQEELEMKAEERKKRQIAEESLRALRSRVSFLLEQLEQASNLCISWQEERTVMQSELASVHSVNTDLRKRLLGLQQTFVGRHICDICDSTADAPTSSSSNSNNKNEWNNNTHLSFGKAPVQLSDVDDVMTGRSGKVLSTLGGVFSDPAADTMPSSVTSIIERALFDTICAFTSGQRSSSGKYSSAYKTQRRSVGNSTNGSNTKNTYRVQQNTDDGSCEIICVNEDNSSSIDADATELLSGLQISAFLKFVRSKPSNKAIPIFVEKIASIMNMYRATMVGLLDEVSDSRIEHAKSISKSYTMTERMDRIRLRCCHERLAKHKTIMKYVREQLKHSDMRLIIDELYTKAEQLIDEIDNTPNNGSWQSSALDVSRTLFQQLIKIADKLSMSSASSGTTTGPVGALEIRLPDSLVDDETLAGVVGLLNGTISSSYDTSKDSTNDGGDDDDNNGITHAHESKQSMGITITPHNYTNKILLLNLRSNNLTDLSTKILSSLIQNATELRMVDLRDNHISTQGYKLLFDAARKNITVVYVTQRQNGCMIEGHREIVANIQKQHTSGNGSSNNNSKNDIDRLIDQAKHPLRIDVRDNNNNSGNVANDFLDTIEYTHKSVDAVDTTTARNTHTKGVNNNNPTSTNMSGKWTPSGLIKATTTTRPSTAGAGGRRGGSSPSPVRSGSYMEDDDDDNAYGNRDTVTVAVTAQNDRNHHDRQSYMTPAATTPTATANSNKIKIGIYLDEKIRKIQEDTGTTGKSSVVDGNSSANGTHYITVRERVLTKTKAVYNNTMKIPEMVEEKQHKSSMSTPTRQHQQRPLSASRSSNSHSPLPLPNSPLPARPTTASSYTRDRLQSAQKTDTMSSSIVQLPSPRGGASRSSTPVTKKNKQKSVQSLLDSLQRLNPAVLF